MSVSPSITRTILPLLSSGPLNASAPNPTSIDAVTAPATTKDLEAPTLSTTPAPHGVRARGRAALGASIPEDTARPRRIRPEVVNTAREITPADAPPRITSEAPRTRH